MSSGSEWPEVQGSRGSSALIFPWLLGMAATANSPVAVFVHQSTGSITVVEGFLDLESLLWEFSSKDSTSPASIASIESLPRVRISDPGLDCPICLAGYETDGAGEAKEMPCGHKFHTGCIDTWLGMHGSCPLCRFSLPAAEEEKNRWKIHVFLTRRITGSGSGLDGDTDSNEEVDNELAVTGG